MEIKKRLVEMGMDYVCSPAVQKFLNRTFGISPEHFKIGFIKEDDGRWYADIKNWPKAFHSNLEMVAGADDMLDALNQGNNYVKMEIAINPENKHDWFKMVKIAQTEMGATYRVMYCKEYRGKAWLCNVCKFVMGKHPDTIFARQIS